MQSPSAALASCRAAAGVARRPCLCEQEPDDRDQRADRHPHDEHVVPGEQPAQRRRQALIVVERQIEAFGVVIGIGEPGVGMVAEMQLPVTAERHEQSDRQENQRLVPARIAGSGDGGWLRAAARSAGRSPPPARRSRARARPRTASRPRSTPRSSRGSMRACATRSSRGGPSGGDDLVWCRRSRSSALRSSGSPGTGHTMMMR